MESNNSLTNGPAELSPQDLLNNGIDSKDQGHSLSSGQTKFSNVLMTSEVPEGMMAGDGSSGDTEIKVGKSPRRILHFSDGTLEEYSTDDEADEVDSPKTVSTVDPKTLPWGSWMWYQTVVAASTSLKVCDYLGEGLANFFGITTPKYQYEIDEYKRMMAEEAAAKKEEDMEMRGWRDDKTEDTVHTSQINAAESGRSSELRY